jgi:hypothetical protein
MARTDPKFMLRMPPDLKARVEEAARANNRSMNAEILARLEGSLSGLADASAENERLRAILSAREAEIASLKVGIAAVLNTMEHTLGGVLKSAKENPRSAESLAATVAVENTLRDFIRVTAEAYGLDPDTMREERQRMLRDLEKKPRSSRSP